MTRQLIVTAVPAGFLVETQYLNTLGYWLTMSRTVTMAFPVHIVLRVADRSDYVIRVR